MLELVNAGTSEYNALQTSIQKRYSNHYQVRDVVHLFARPRHRAGRPAPPISITTYTTDPITKVSDQHLDDLNAMGDQDRPHILSLSGAVEVPHTKGLNLSGVWQYNSGTPFTLTDSNTDPNRNGVFEEPLPAGTYSGAATNVNAITRRERGRLQRRARPGLFARQHPRPATSSSCPDNGNRCIRALRRRLQRHEPRELQQPDRRSSRRRDVPDPALDPQRRPEPDRAVQREVRLLASPTKGSDTVSDPSKTTKGSDTVSDPDSRSTHPTHATYPTYPTHFDPT